MFRAAIAIVVLSLTMGCNGPSADSTANSQSGAKPFLRVMLIPADGGTEEGTKADFEPIFRAIGRQYDLRFNIKVGQSYGVVVEGMANQKIDIAFFGPVTFHQAKQRGVAELLAVGVDNGESVYHAGIFARHDSSFENLADLRAKSVAFGDVNSTSSFNVPVAMLIAAGVDPLKDLGKVYMTGSHSNALAALAAGKVDAACASYSSFQKAASSGHIDPQQIGPIAKSQPIPYPPIAMHVGLAAPLKQKLREAFNKVHTLEGVSPEMIRGYGGKKVDRYNADFSEAEFDKAMALLSAVTDDFKEQMLKKAADN